MVILPTRSGFLACLTEFFVPLRKVFETGERVQLCLAVESCFFFFFNVLFLQQFKLLCQAINISNFNSGPQSQASCVSLSDS